MQPHPTNDTRREEQENTVLCINRTFSDFTECNDISDVKLINWIYWISRTSCIT